MYFVNMSWFYGKYTLSVSMNLAATAYPAGLDVNNGSPSVQDANIYMGKSNTALCTLYFMLPGIYLIFVRFQKLFTQGYVWIHNTVFA